MHIHISNFKFISMMMMIMIQILMNIIILENVFDFIFFIPEKMVELLIFSMCVVLTMMWFLGWNPKKEEASNDAIDRRNYKQVYMNLGRKGGLSIVKTVIFAFLKPIFLEKVEKAWCRLAKRHPLLRMKVKL